MRILANTTTKSDFEFNSIYEFIEHTKTATRTEGSRDSSEESGSSWTGTRNIEEAYDIAISGGDFTRQLSENITLMEESKTVQAVPVNMFFDVTGPVLDVGLMLTGQPECFLNYEYAETSPPQTRFLTMYIDLGAHGGIDSSTMLSRAAAIATIIDILEAQNVRVRVILEHYGVTGKGSTPCARVSMVAKQYNELLQINKLAGALHPSFYRRLVFKHFECCKFGPKYTKSGYGYGVSGDHSNKTECYHFPRIDYNWMKFDADYIKRTINEIQTVLR